MIAPLEISGRVCYTVISPPTSVAACQRASLCAFGGRLGMTFRFGGEPADVL